MSDEQSETSRSGDAGAEVTPDEEAAAEPSTTEVPIGIPTSPENWRDLKRRADDPDDIASDQPDDHSK